MKKSVFTMEASRQLTEDVYELILSGDSSAVTAPGQFVNIELPDKYLRRPISICDWSENTLTLLVRVVGGGTDELVHFEPGTKLDVLSGLGNGFDMDLAGEHAVLAGGGIGIAPLFGLARRMVERGQTCTVALGFRCEKDAFYVEEFSALGCRVLVSTEDGSFGTRGFVTDCIKSVPECDYLFTCGPLPMLKAVHDLPLPQGGQYSFEARMGCGFGACMGCTIPTKDGYKRVCKDGPILYKEEIVW